MSYLTLCEYQELGFEDVEDFSSLRTKAEMIIDLFTDYFYHYNDIEKDIPLRKNVVKRAIAYQISYMDSSGITSAEDKQSLNSVSIGRTTLNYGSSSDSLNEGARFNLSQDAYNLLKNVGFGYRGVLYDR